MSPPLRHAAFAAVILCASMTSAHGVDGSWANGGGGSWSSPASWADQTIPSGVQTVVAFNAVDLKRDATITLDGSATAGHLSFGDPDPSHGWLFRPGSGGTLTLDVTSGVPEIHVDQLTTTIGVNLAGLDGLSKTGAGTLVLSGNNLFSGPTLVNQGTLRLGSPPQFPTGLQIMPLGDSITHGYNGSNAGYRGPLHLLVNPIMPAFRYIGTSSQRPGSLPTAPIYQRFHEGHSSYSLQDASNNLDGFDNAKFLQYGGADRDPNGGYWLIGENGTGRPPVFPDVITMMLGTNDMNDLEGVEGRLRALVTKITTLRPDTLLLMATITPLTAHAGVDGYNAIVVQVAAEFQAAGKKVRLVDLNTGFPADGLFWDGVHPNDTGFQWMAVQWYEALLASFTPRGSNSHAIPSSSAVTIQAGATLDLDGCTASTGAVSNHGILDLGENGMLETSHLIIRPGGIIRGDGGFQGNVVNNSAGLGQPGQSLAFNGQVTNNSSLHPGSGASLHFNGNLINNGSLTISPGRTFTFQGDLINNGVLHLVDGALLDVSGTFINNGTLDLITSAHGVQQAFVNEGVIIDASAFRVEDVWTSMDSLHLQVSSHSGHVYQLQKSETLEPDSWMDTGESQSGLTGSSLIFSDPVVPGTRCFYRVRLSP